MESVSKLEPYDGPPRNVKYIEQLNFDKGLKPKEYQILGTHPDSKILILDVEILDSTGKEPYCGDVYIEGMLSYYMDTFTRPYQSLRSY